MKSPPAAGSSNGSDIAVIGMACRFPGANTPDEFWRNLRDGVESTSWFSDEQLLAAGEDPEQFNDSRYVKARPILRDIELFDAAFFGFTPREAEVLDPQQRLLLECAWEALEYAGYNTETYKGVISILAGASFSNYLVHNLYENRPVMESFGDFQSTIFNVQDSLATRIAYKLNLKGACFSVQTFCSTSLVAVHLACQSLLNLESDMALAGGVTVYVPQQSGYLCREGGLLSPDGHCRTFDARANGTVFGNGLGLVVLRRLEEALADGDTIHAVIRGSAINNDGSLKASYAAPSVVGQTEVIVEALAAAGVDPRTISYVETHGTGTRLGDPAEIAALTKAFRTHTDDKGFCAVGSVKANVGHLDAAAGMAGMIKTILALKHGQIPPNPQFESPNPEIDFDNSPFYVNTKLIEWKGNGGTDTDSRPQDHPQDLPQGRTAHRRRPQEPRRAGVSAFGIGGTNAHLILEEPPAPQPHAAPPSAVPQPAVPSYAVPELWREPERDQLLLLSARTPAALDQATQNLVTYLRSNPPYEVPPSAVPSSAVPPDAVPPSAVPPYAVPARNLADVAYTLQVGRRSFAYRRMVVCNTVVDCAAALEARDPQRVISSHTEQRNPPVVFMFPGEGPQYLNLGLNLYHQQPTFRETVDRCCEVVKPYLDLDLREVFDHGDADDNGMIQRLNQASTADRRQQSCRPQDLVLFVVEYALAKLWMSWGIKPESLIGQGVGEYVAGSVAGIFSLEDALRLFADGVDRITFSPPQIPCISSITGTWITAEQATDPQYWTPEPPSEGPSSAGPPSAGPLPRAARFEEGMQTVVLRTAVVADSKRVLLEVGPGKEQDTAVGSTAVGSTAVRSTAVRSTDGAAYLLAAVGRLWLAGVEVDWAGFHAHQHRRRVPLPTYPFERRRFWVESLKKTRANAKSPAHLEKAPDPAQWFYHPVWRTSIQPSADQVTVGSTATGGGSAYLLFVDSCGVGEGVAARLRRAGCDVVTVKAGEAFAGDPTGGYTINPQRHDDYVALIGSLKTQGRIPHQIGHFWSVEAADGSPYAGSPYAGSPYAVPPYAVPLDGESLVGPDRFQKTCALGFYSLLHLCQAIAEHELTDALQLKVISTNMHEVIGGEAVAPEKATLLALCKVIPQEQHNIRCCSIDIELPQTGVAQDQAFMDQLAVELQAGPPSAGPSPHTVVAHRRLKRWVQAFDWIDPTAIATPTSRLREGGVYLVTGGLGNVGYVLATHLAKSARAKLILTGRSALPPRKRWDQWLTTHPELDETSRRIKRVQSLEALGASVLVASADVADLDQMRAVVDQARKRFGQIHGVIHAAGVLAAETFRPFRELSPTECERQFLPKVHGLYVLDQLFADQSLDFVLLTSSLSSVLGGLSYTAYAAANLFMDAFANHRRSQYRRTQYRQQESETLWISVNWDQWGFGEQQPDGAVERSSLAKLAMTPQEGTAVFDKILRLPDLAQIVISTASLYARIATWINLDQLHRQKSTETARTPRQARPAELEDSYAAPQTPMENLLADIWQDALGVDRVGVLDNFFDLGGHSLLTIQVIATIEEKTGLRITVDEFLLQTLGQIAGDCAQRTGSFAVQ